MYFYCNSIALAYHAMLPSECETQEKLMNDSAQKAN